jgi:hypothetical protein
VLLQSQPGTARRLHAPPFAELAAGLLQQQPLLLLHQCFLAAAALQTKLQKGSKTGQQASLACTVHLS